MLYINYAALKCHANGASYAAVILADKGLGNFISLKGVTYTNCTDLWKDIDILDAKDVAGIFLSANTCQTTSICTDAAGCSATPNSANYLFLNFNPDTSSVTDNIPVALDAGNYLGCVFIDSYNADAAHLLPWPAPGVAFINGGGNTGQAGPTFADSTQQLPVPSSGALISLGGGL